MKSESDRLERNRESVRRWYARHRDEYAELRRQRYAADAERRVVARVNAADYREKRKKGLLVKRVLHRELNGVQIPVYTSGYVADLLKCSQQVLRNWEIRGWIKKSLFPDRHRFYTLHQVGLMKMLAAIIRDGGKTLRVRSGEESKALSSMIELIHKTWEAQDATGKNVAGRRKKHG